MGDDANHVEDFQRLESLGDDFDEYINGSSSFNYRSQHQHSAGDPDKKMEALQNTAANGKSLNDSLKEQWRLVDADEKVKAAGELIIDYLDEKGYLSIRLEQLHNKDKHDFGIEHLQQALALVQKLEPTGVGARNVQECLLIQMRQHPEDMSFEIRLVQRLLGRTAGKPPATHRQKNELHPRPAQPGHRANEQTGYLAGPFGRAQ